MSLAAATQSRSYAIKPFLADPLLSAVYHRKVHRYYAVITIPLGFLAMMLGAAAIEGNLGSLNDIGTGILDYWKVLRSPANWTIEDGFPLLRDVASLIIALTLGVQTGNVYSQWEAIAAMGPSVTPNSGTGVLLDPQGVLADEIDRANRFFERVGKLGPVTMLASWIAGILIISSLARNGVFSMLHPNNSNAFAADAYASWWARDTNVLGLMAYTCIGVMATYYLILQTAVGMRLMVLVVRISYHLNPLSLTNPLRPNDDVQFTMKEIKDDSFGWGSVARTPSTITTAVTVDLFALSFLVFQLNWSKGLWLAGFLVMFILLNPTYVLLPLACINSRVRAAREIESKSLISVRDDQSVDPVARSEAGARLAWLIDTPRFPIKLERPFIWKQLLFALSLVIAVVTAIQTVRA